MFGEFLTSSTNSDLRRSYSNQPLRKKLHMLLESAAVKLLVGVASVASFVGVVKDTDSRASGDPVPEWLTIIEYVVFAVFALELAVRSYVERLAALRSLYTLADIAVVFTAAAEYALLACGVDAGLSKVNLLRLARTMKLVQMVYRVPFFVELRKLMYMISSCMKTLVWSFLVLGVVMTVWAIVAVELIHPRVLELSSQGQWSDCERCSRSFSTVFHANITFFKTIVAGDSWGLMAVPVIEAHPWSALIFIGASLSLVFGVLNVIVAVVVDAFAEARAKDVFTRARELEWDEQQEKKVLSNMFSKMDRDGHGVLGIDDLKKGARRVRQFSHLLRVLDIDACDLEEMFAMLDRDGSGDINCQEFVEWMYRMKNTDAKTVTQFSKQKLLSLVEKMDTILESGTVGGGAVDEPRKEDGWTDAPTNFAMLDRKVPVQGKGVESQLSDVSRLLAQSLQRSESLHREIEEGFAEVRKHVRDSLSVALSPRDPPPAAEPFCLPLSPNRPGCSATAPVPPWLSPAPLLLRGGEVPTAPPWQRGPAAPGAVRGRGSAEAVGAVGRAAEGPRSGGEPPTAPPWQRGPAAPGAGRGRGSADAAGAVGSAAEGPRSGTGPDWAAAHGGLGEASSGGARAQGGLERL